MNKAREVKKMPVRIACNIIGRTVRENEEMEAQTEGDRGR